MATILIVDDRHTNREFLVTLLSYGGHRLLEAADGAEALEIVRDRRPDLVITDILMPTMDGYEFVQQLRADPALAHTVVIFYTATYGIQEARTLARAARVAYVIDKPAEPQKIIDTVNAALGLASSASTQFETKPLTDPVHMVAAKLSDRVNQLDTLSQRLAMLIELGLEAGRQRDTLKLLENFCHAARRIIGAKYAAVGVLNDDGQTLRHFFTSGLDADSAARIGDPPAGKGLLGALLTERQPIRVRDIAADPRSAGFPPNHPPMRSFLGVPIASANAIYGRLYLTEKLAADEFSDEDERVAVALAGQIAVAYENVQQYNEIQRHAATLQLEMTERKRFERELSQQRDLYETLLKAMSDLEHGVAVANDKGQFVFMNDALARIYGYTTEEMLSMPSAWGLLPAEELPRLQERFRRRMRGEPVPEHFEIPGVRKDGRRIDLEIAVKLLPMSSGSQVILIARDISERKQSEEALRESEARLRSVLENMPVMLDALDDQGNIIVWNRECERVTGYSADQIINHPRAAELLYPDAVYREHMQSELAASGDDYRNWEWETTCKDGSRRTIAWSNLSGRFPIPGWARWGIGVDVTERRRAEDALRASEERYRLLFDSNPMPMWAYDVETLRFLAVNDAAVAHYLYSRDDFQTMTIRDIRPPDELPRLLSNLESQPQPRERAGVWTHRKKDGTLISVEIVSHTVLFDGRAARLVLANDVTERQRAEAALETAHGQLKNLFDNLDEVFFSLDSVNWQALQVSPACEKVYGLSQRAFLDNPRLWQEMIHPDDRDRVSADNPIWFTGHATHSEYRIVRPEGSIRWLESRVKPTLDSAGRLVRLDGVVSDITERKRADAALLESEARYHRVLDAMMEGCQIIDYEWRYVYVNDVVANQGKRKPEELLGHTMMEVYPGVENTELFAVLRQCMEDRTPRRMENPFLFPDGSSGWFELSIQPAREGIFILSTDISDRKRAEAELVAKNEEIGAMTQQLWQAAKLATMGELAASIAHELNNPLATVSLRVESLLSQVPAGDPKRRALEIIAPEIDRMANLVSNLLQFGRRGQPAKSSVDVREELVKTLELIEHHLYRGHITVATAFAPDVPLALADRQQLRQLFLNLFTNASDTMPRGGTLTVRAAPGLLAGGAPAVVIEVADTGEGIPPEALPKVWDAFYTTKPEGQGTGLGLAICKRIVEEHGGTIDIASEGPGMGATVHIRLPSTSA